MRKNQSGNVFVIILVGIALFAALGYTVSRGFRSDSTNNLTKRQADLAAGEILNYAQKISRTVNRLRRNGCSESEISFENSAVADYDFVTRDACRVFGATGAKLIYKAPESSWLASANSGSAGYGSWWFGGTNIITDVGGNTQPGNNELLAVVGYLDQNLCIRINDKLGITNPAGVPPQDGSASVILADAGKYTGTFAGSNAITDTNLDGKSAACFESGGTGPATGTYHFYQVLIER